jgi:hypothetical protein
MIKLSISFFIVAATSLYGGGGCLSLGHYVHMCPDPPARGEQPSDHKDLQLDEDPESPTYGEWEEVPCDYLLNPRLAGNYKREIYFWPDGTYIHLNAFTDFHTFRNAMNYYQLWNDKMSKKYKYVINNWYRFRYLSNVKNFFRHYEKFAKKAGVEIEIVEWNRYEFSIYGHENLPDISSKKIPNPFYSSIKRSLCSKIKATYDMLKRKAKIYRRGSRPHEQERWALENLSDWLDKGIYYPATYIKTACMLYPDLFEIRKNELANKVDLPEAPIKMDEKKEEKIARKKMLANKTASQKEDALKKASIRTFTNKFGAEIKGQLVGVAYLKKAVVLRCSKNERLYVPISSFSESDLNYIKNWLAENS